MFTVFKVIWSEYESKLNLSSTSPVIMHDPGLVITVAADGLAPDGARPSAATVMTIKLCFPAFIPRFYGCHWFCVTFGLDDIP